MLDYGDYMNIPLESTKHLPLLQLCSVKLGKFPLVKFMIIVLLSCLFSQTSRSLRDCLGSITCSKDFVTYLFDLNQDTNFMRSYLGNLPIVKCIHRHCTIKML